MKKDKEREVATENETPITEEVNAEETAAETEQTQTAEEQEQPTEAQWREALELAVAQRDEAAQKRDEYLDAYKRSQADFQNFKRRNATSRADGFTDGVCDVIGSILPLFDNLERALQAAQPEDPLAEGVRMSVKAAMEGLAKFGFEEIPALGEEFNPELHNAVMRGPGEEPGKILDVFQKGYRVKDKIVRYSMVKVASDD